MRLFLAAGAAMLLHGCSPSWKAGDPIPAGHAVEAGLMGERYLVSPTTQRFNRCLGAATRGSLQGAGAEALLILPIYLLGASAVCGIVAEVEREPAKPETPGRATQPAAPPGAQPRCEHVGGYESYKARTGEVCRL